MFRAIFSCLLQHRIRNIDTHHRLADTGQRDRATADTTAEIEGSGRGELRIYRGPDCGEHEIDMILAGLEEVSERIVIKPVMKTLLVCCHSVVRVIPSQISPIPDLSREVSPSYLLR